MTPISRRALLGAAPLAAAGGVAGVTLTPSDAEAASARKAHLGLWDTARLFGTGVRSAVTVDSRGGLVLGSGTRRYTYRDPHGTTRRTEYGNWTSGRITPRTGSGAAFGASELIASWNAATPAGTWVEVAVQVRTTSGRTTRWYVLGRWASGDGSSDIKRTSVAGMSDAYGSVSTDTLVMKGSTRIASYQVRATLHRLAGTSATPRIALLSAIATALPTSATVATSPKGGAQGKVLAVPAYSQEKHRGHYPAYDGGGEAWCSATSTAMVLDYWKLGPSASVTKWVTVAGETRPQVDHAARLVYDHEYDGCGNWPFNTAYAGARGARAYVTRLRSLTEAEQFISAGVPLIASVSFAKGELDGAGYGTNGHLLVIVGFDRNGDVVVNDPASHLAASDAQVRTTYKRGQLENAWLPHSGGTVYVIAPWGHRLPTRSADGPNWV